MTTTDNARQAGLTLPPAKDEATCRFDFQRAHVQGWNACREAMVEILAAQSADASNPVEMIGIEFQKCHASEAHPRDVDTLLEALNCTLREHGFKVTELEDDEADASNAATGQAWRELRAALNVLAVGKMSAATMRELAVATLQDFDKLAAPAAPASEPANPYGARGTSQGEAWHRGFNGERMLGAPGSTYEKAWKEGVAARNAAPAPAAQAGIEASGAYEFLKSAWDDFTMEHRGRFTEAEFQRSVCMFLRDFVAGSLPAIIASFSKPARQHQSGEAGADARDAARWRTTLRFISAWLSGGRRQVWSLEALPIPVGVNLMRGSVAEHFTNAVDAVSQGERNG